MNDIEHSQFNNNSLGFGTWPLGGYAYGPVSQDQAYMSLNTALNLGIRLFDTADIYGNGKVEELLGNVAGKTPFLKIITKVGYISEESSRQRFDERYIWNRLEKSLKRLNRSKMDFYLLHSPPRNILDDNEVRRVFEKIKVEGLSEKVGVSLRSIEMYRRALNWDACEVIEVIFNLLDQRALDNGLIQTCLNNNIKVFARLPLCAGFLTGKYPVGYYFPKNDTRSRWTRKQVDIWCKSVGLFRILINTHRNLAQAAIAFCLCPQVNVIPIPGMKSPSQVIDNLRALHKENTITPNEFNKIRKTWSAIKHIPPK